jgi:hypothetical protein
MKISEWWFSLPVLMSALVFVLMFGLANSSYGAEKCADGTECPAEKSEPTDEELEDSCSDEGVSL